MELIASQIYYSVITIYIYILKVGNDTLLSYKNIFISPDSDVFQFSFRPIHITFRLIILQTQTMQPLFLKISRIKFNQLSQSWLIYWNMEKRLSRYKSKNLEEMVKKYPGQEKLSWEFSWTKRTTQALMKASSQKCTWHIKRKTKKNLWRLVKSQKCSQI